MKRILTLTVLLLALMLVLTACGCKHETWLDATCDTPKTCAECGQTEGEALGHSWQEATCEEPKTCTVCKKTEGGAAGHDWQEATCEDAKACAVCGLTEGEALGHTWQEATTEEPKTCTACGITEGDKIVTDPRFTTAATSHLQGLWSMDYDLASIMETMIPGWSAPLDCLLMLELNNDGTWRMYMKVADETEFRKIMAELTLEMLYAEMEAEGISREDTDALMEGTYGMTTEEFIEATMEEMDMDELMADANESGVYYANETQLFMGYSWDGDFEGGTAYTLTGDTLELESYVEIVDLDTMVFTRVPQE